LDSQVRFFSLFHFTKKKIIFRYRLNTLYVYEKYGHEYPNQFWLLSNVKEITHLDDFILEIAFECELVMLKFTSLDNLLLWQNMLTKAKNFQAENYFTGETVTEISQVYISMDSQLLLTFNMDANDKLVKRNILFLTKILDVKMKELKPECTLVVKNDEFWRISFSQYTYCAKFVAYLESLCL